MRVLITGASSGLGREMAKLLDAKGVQLVLAARRWDRLEALAATLRGDARLLPLDLSLPENCFALHRLTSDQPVDILINNAGRGVYGPFAENSLEQELEMLDLNIRALHILTKLYLRDFRSRDRGIILNVASSAAFQPGPLLASYYASKAYVLRLTQAVGEELRREGSRVSLCAFCPGPVETGFDRAAGVTASLPGMAARKAALLALRGMFARQSVIVPGATVKLARVFQRLAPDGVLLRAAYEIQKTKSGRPRGD